MKVCVVGSGGSGACVGRTRWRVPQRWSSPRATRASSGRRRSRRPRSTRTSTSSAPRLRSWRDWPMISALAGSLVFGPGADGALLEGSKAFMKELLVDAGVPTAAHATFTERESALQYLDRAGASVCDQDRRTRRRQGGSGHRIATRGAECRRGLPLRRGVRSGGTASRDRRGAHRIRALVLRRVRWETRRAAAVRGGPQAHRRWRPGAEHRRYGCVLPGRLGSPRHGRSDQRSVPRADDGGAALTWHRLPRRAVRWADAHSGRPEDARVQRALR